VKLKDRDEMTITTLIIKKEKKTMIHKDNHGEDMV
jgi:hypothetical protein